MENKKDDGYETTSGQSLLASSATVATSQQAPELSAKVASRPRGAGRGLGWSDDELTALVVQGYDGGRDPTVDAGQTAERYADRMRSAFLSKMPPGACTATGTKCALDNCRWTGRPAAVCLRKYKEVI
jgi:hypothetical protein